MSTVLKVENLSKQYRLGTVGSGTLRDDMTRFWAKLRGKEDPTLKIGEVNDRTTKGNSEYVWALKDINFEVKQGEILGIIGKNGAGKSTLLKILSKVTGPTTGRVRAKGRIASLLEVGTGFHPELTGRENIYLNGAILGMTKAEIHAKLDEIVDFAGVEKYLDTPVKRYSSGMTVRLGFAVAAHLEPEILIVDEVLAVGDAEFQKKAIGKMQDVSRGEGRTVLFVSHNMAAVSSLCERGLLLKDGKLFYQGNIKDVVENYLKGNFNTNITENFQENDFFKFNSVHIYNQDGLINDFPYNSDIIIELKYSIFQKLKGLLIGLEVYNNLEQKIIAVSDIDKYPDLDSSRDVGEFDCRFIIPKCLMNQGSYIFSIVAHNFYEKVNYHKFIYAGLKISSVGMNESMLYRGSILIPNLHCEVKKFDLT